MKVEVKYILPEETIRNVAEFTKKNRKNLNFMINKFLLDGLEVENKNETKKR